MILAIMFRHFGFIAPKTLNDEGYSRNTSRSLYFISTFLLLLLLFWQNKLLLIGKSQRHPGDYVHADLMFVKQNVCNKHDRYTAHVTLNDIQSVPSRNEHMLCLY